MESHDKIALLGKGKLGTIEVLISKAFFYTYISHNACVSVNSMLREYNEMKEEIKNPKKAVEFTI